MRDFHSPGRSPALSANAMVATSMTAATLAALDILRQGGNAMDGAIAAAAVLAVIEPQSTGIGGDCFCLYVPAGGDEVVALNGSGRAPAAATPEALRAAGLTAMVNTSAHSVTVPGAISAWDLLSRTHGRLGLDAVLQPAIRYAEEGHPVTPRVASDWASSAGKLAKHPASARRFLTDGKTPGVGDIFRQPELGATLRAIAKDGARAFYTGPIAADMVATLREAGGLHTEEDFAEGLTVAEFVTPIRTRWRGMEVHQCPPNGSGMLVLQILNTLAGFETPEGGPLSPTRLHRHIEAARLAYRDRDAFLADPSQVDVPVEHLISPAYGEALRALIRDDRAMPELPPAGQADWQRHKDTVYLCVVDKDGNAVSFINSLFEGFGSGILAEKSGVMLQNRGFGFRLQEGHPNCIAPRKRPMHTIIPGMVTQGGRAIMPYGVMGGHFQPMGQTYFLSNHFEFGLDPQAALDLARLFPSTGKVQVERGIPGAVIDQLERLGHGCTLIDKPHGGGQAIRIDHARGVLIGGSDPRKDGIALGY
ncbi:gamma-glutamyltransferase family protein [Roseomonas sp. OT10]|uniref:gamma-glutamyltransferase family protein n=1 Tax=Roseomonas cutis TaxID=2897332 RepID=UPI001E2D341F|nr:gamma-glutamyltransferase family protein [Roseomonas sp. OT10]UFN51420.1 gamma-glutamyltransferase family protein [Roseomonas sp. OT10]